MASASQARTKKQRRKRKADSIKASDVEGKRPTTAPTPPIAPANETTIEGRRLWLDTVTVHAANHLEGAKPLGSIVALYAIAYNPDICAKCAVQLMYFGGRCRGCGSATQSKLHIAIWDSVRVSDEEFKKWQTKWPRIAAVIAQSTVTDGKKIDLFGLSSMLAECKLFNRYLTDLQLRAVFTYAVPQPEENRSTAESKALVTLLCNGFLMANPDPCWSGDTAKGSAFKITKELTDKYKAMNQRELKLIVLEGPMALVNRLSSAASASASSSAASK